MGSIAITLRWFALRTVIARHFDYGRIVVEHCDCEMRWFTVRSMIQRVYGLTNDVQKRHATQCICDTAFFLMEASKLPAIPGLFLISWLLRPEEPRR